MEYLTMKKKIEILEHAFAAAVGAYYSINLTKDLVPGSMYQVIDDTEYSLNEQMSLPENARFSDVVRYWGNKLSPEEQESYFEFFSISNLLAKFQDGQTHGDSDTGSVRSQKKLCGKISGISKDSNRLLLSFQSGNKLYPYRSDCKG